MITLFIMKGNSAPGTILSTWEELSHWIFPAVLWGSSVIVPILQRRKLKPNSVYKLPKVAQWVRARAKVFRHAVLIQSAPKPPLLAAVWHGVEWEQARVACARWPSFLFGGLHLGEVVSGAREEVHLHEWRKWLLPIHSPREGTTFRSQEL